MLISFEDAVTASNLDPNQKYAVYYADGRYANRAAVAAQCPQAKLFGITVGGLTGPTIFACDSETGDLDVPQTLRWVENQIQLGVKLICVYANLDRFLNLGLLAGVETLERKYGVKVRKWLAHYTGNPVLEYPWVDAEQYADPGPVDLNVALATFFGDLPPTPTPPEGTMAITAARNADGRLEVFVHLETGEVKHTAQQTANGDWWKDSQGNVTWLSLGTPGK